MVDPKDTDAASTWWRRVGSAGRLAIVNALILALIVGAVVFVFIRNFTTSYESVAASSIAVEVQQYEQQAVRTHPKDLETFSRGFLETSAIAPGEVMVIDISARGLLSTPGSSAVLAWPRVAQWLSHPPTSTVTLSTTLAGRPTEVVVAPIVTGRSVVGTFVATSDLSDFAAERSREIRLSIVEGILALLLGVLSTFAILRGLLRKVGRITATAREIGNGDLGQRLGDQGSNDEVGELAVTFDTMLDRLQATMTAQRRLLSDVSHQLRTPLTAARGHLEVLGRGRLDEPGEIHATLDVVIDQLDHTRSVVERLLMLGHAMEPDFLDRHPVEIRAVIREVLDAVRILAPRDFRDDEAPDMAVEIDVEKVRGALLNLVDNAVRATSTGDVVSLGASYDEENSLVRLNVDDSGPGIPESERRAVLERFQRPGARDRDGSGLGLAIVKAVAEAHDGWIEITTSPLGGARVTMVLAVEPNDEGDHP